MRSLELFSLAGRVALVTGGSRGLGLEIARGLGEAGASIAITARRQQWLSPAVEELRSQGIDCEGYLGDVSRLESVETCVASVLQRSGTIDILVNNAGITWGAPPESMPLDKWRAVLDVNATGLFIVTQVVGRHMLERGSGRIINVASIVGLRGSRSDVLQAAGYTASKGAVIALTRDLACQWAARGVTVNAIAPGFFPTRMTEGLIADRGDRILSGIPLGRLGAPDDIKGAAVYLASPAGAYVTGQVLSVDGGATAW